MRRIRKTCVMCRICPRCACHRCLDRHVQPKPQQITRTSFPTRGWPGFCLAFDVVLGGLVLLRLWRRRVLAATVTAVMGNKRVNKRGNKHKSNPQNAVFSMQNDNSSIPFTSQPDV